MKKPDLDLLCQQACDIALQAGLIILDVYNNAYDIQEKEDKTPVTTADMLADKLICQQLKRLTPDIPVLSEESAKIPYSIRKNWHRYWLVDPLDGTREFIKHNDEFTVNIALIENTQSILGVIYVPVSCNTYYAWKNNGAYKIDPEGKYQPIHTRPLAKKPVIAGSRSHGAEKLQHYLARLGDIELLSIGSSLKSCLVAEGKVDLYPRLGLTSEWDTAAAQCIVEEAGGKLVQTNMQPMRYNTKDSLLNPEFFVFGDTSHDWSKYL
jgi:3'(2'), 5'-bisphosphate nucleotidase